MKCNVFSTGMCLDETVRFEKKICKRMKRTKRVYVKKLKYQAIYVELKSDKMSATSIEQCARVKGIDDTDFLNCL